MTAFTDDGFVCPDESESVGRSGMIKDGSFPCGGGVTLQTGGRETGAFVFVLVIELMTGETVILTGRREDQGEIGWLMAGCTGNRLVCSDESKSVGL